MLTDDNDDNTGRSVTRLDSADVGILLTNPSYLVYSSKVHYPSIMYDTFCFCTMAF